VSDPILFEELQRALYVNPLDSFSANALQVHSHILTLKNEVKSMRQVTPSTALDVYHLVSNSTINRARVHVFKIETNEELVILDSPPAPLRNNGGRFCEEIKSRVLYILCSLYISFSNKHRGSA
jgi:hypothetical protein